MTQAFNLSQFANNVNTSGQASLTAAVSGTLPVANGGTGATSLTANNVILGNGTGAVQVVAPSTSGNVLTSNGTTWTSAAAPLSAGSLIGYNVYTTTGANTYTKATNNPSFVIVEVQGAGGAQSAAGGTSSFGAFCSATGGALGNGGASGVGASGDINVTPMLAPRLPATNTNVIASTVTPIMGAKGILGDYGSGGNLSISVASNANLFGIAGAGAGGYTMKKILASALAASETVTVGAGGDVGTGSTAGRNGIVIVWEYR